MADDGCVNISDYQMMKLGILGGFNASNQRRIDGADAYAENVRYDYLTGKDNVSFAEGTGQRLVTESGSGQTRREINNPPSGQ